MKKDFDKDELDDFLQRNLSAYSENPPDHLWDGVAAGLAPPKPPMRAGSRSGRLASGLALASIALLAGLLGQRAYYQRQIDALQRQINRQAVAGAPERAPAAVRPNGASGIHDHTYFLSDAATGARPPANPSRATQADPFRITPGPLPLQEPVVPQKAPQEAAAMAGPGSETARPVRPAQRVAPCIPGPLSFLRAGAPGISPAAQPVVLGKKTGKWSVLAQCAYFTEQSDIAFKQFPSSGPGSSKVFQEDLSVKGQVILTGLGLERKLSRQFSLQTGLAFKQTLYTASHQAMLRFGDRHGHGPGGPPDPTDNHNFRYQVNTPTGAMQVDVRVSEVGGGIPAQDQEIVELAFTRQEISRYLSVPLLAKYTLGKNRLKIAIKAGLLTDILLQNQQTLAGASSLNPRFRIETGTPPTATNAGLKPMALSCLAAAGLEFNLSPRVLFQLEPTLIRSLTARQKDPDVIVGRLATGLNAGVRVQF
ncbi:MAG: hypothetical protein ACR2K1_05110 [Saprospiraceae bacterium]